MLEVHCATPQELAAALAPYQGEAVFRGQSKDYRTSAGEPSIVTSFSRLGCIPALMLKWTYYAQECLRALGIEVDMDDLAGAQALLQHYGWRSFFVDATASWRVAAWFAAHKFSGQAHLAMAEDCFEKPVTTAHQVAAYSPITSNEIGHLFAVSLNALERHGVGGQDLSRLVPADGEARFSRQHAWLIGPLATPLDAEVVVLHVTAPAGVLLDTSISEGLTTSFLFPGRHEDPFLALLLSVPWRRVEDTLIYRRSLTIPEYDWRPRKFIPEAEALVDEFWIATDRHELEPESWLHKAPFFRTTETAMYAMRLPERPIPQVLTLLRRHRHAVVELDNLIRHPEFAHSPEYGKGVALELDEDGTIEISELLVDHPGTVPTGMGVSKGWRYEVDEGAARLSRRSDPRDCPCGNSGRHEQHTRLVHWLEACLADGRLVQRSELEFDLIPG